MLIRNTKIKKLIKWFWQRMQDQILNRMLKTKEDVMKKDEERIIDKLRDNIILLILQKLLLILAQSTKTHKKFYKIYNIWSSLREFHWLKKLQWKVKNVLVLAQSTQTYKKSYGNHNILASLWKIYWLKKF